MGFKWTAENERKLLMLALNQSSKPAIDAQKILDHWPDDEKPTKGTAGTRFGQLWRQSQVYDFGAGMRDSRRSPVGGGEPVKATPSRRTSTSSKGGSSRKSSGNGKQSQVLATNNGFQVPATPLKTEDNFCSTPTPIGSTGDSSGENSVNSQITTNGTSSRANSTKKSDPNRAWANETATSANANGKKRKSSAMSDSESDSAKSSPEDEMATPTKTISSLPSSDRRPSLPRRSKSATPGKARYTGAIDDNDGTGKDDAAKEIDSGEEWKGSDEDGGKGKGGTPSKKKKMGWRERTGGRRRRRTMSEVAAQARHYLDEKSRT